MPGCMCPERNPSPTSLTLVLINTGLTLVLINTGLTLVVINTGDLLYALVATHTREGERECARERESVA